MTRRDFTIWQERYNAIDTRIQELLTTVTGSMFINSRVPTMRTLLEEFRPFAQKHFTYFYQNFTANRLEEHPRFSREYVMRKVTTRLSEDLDALEKCVSQRRLQSDIEQRLQIADSLAFKALHVAKSYRLVDESTTAITYFGKVPTVRVIPYAHVALIGLPWTCLTLSTDFLSIPHEIGHHVFWSYQSKKMREHIADRLKGSPVWLQNWAEEIFADVYGAVVAGSPITLSFQDLENETSPEEFVRDDERHPIPAIRPFIYHKVLWALGASQAGALEQRWQDLLKKRKALPLSAGKLGFLSVQGETKNERIHAQDVEQEIEGLLDTIGTFLPLKPPAAPPDGEAFPREDQHAPVDTLYDDFDKKVQELHIPFMQTAEDVSTTEFPDWVATRAQGAPLAEGAAEGALETAGALAPAQAPPTIPYREWMEVLKAAGWTSAGPHSRDLD